MAFVEYNSNPVGRKVGDCAVRAIAKALKTDLEPTELFVCKLSKV